jgi:hypothetical protein
VSGHVFISYSHPDRAYVEELAAHLAYGGIAVWYDYQIEVGSRFDSVIQQQIDDCSAVIVVLSPDSVDSEWVRREIGYADTRGKPTLPLILRSCDIPLRLVSSHYEDVTGGGMPSKALEARLKRLIDVPSHLNAPASGSLAAEPRNTGTTSRTKSRSTQADTDRRWPDPRPIQTGEEFSLALRRTWIRAGSPSDEEVSRRTGGIVTAEQAQKALESNRHYSWLDVSGEWASLSLLLGAYGIPEDLMRSWRQALERRARITRRKVYRSEILMAIVLALVGAAIAFLVGAAVPQMSSASFGAGNWWAVGISLAVLLLLGFMSLIPADDYSSRLKVTTIILYGVALATGWVLTPYLHSGVVPHAGLIARDWLGWRF